MFENKNLRGPWHLCCSWFASLCPTWGRGLLSHRVLAELCCRLGWPGLRWVNRGWLFKGQLQLRQHQGWPIWSSHPTIIECAVLVLAQWVESAMTLCHSLTRKWSALQGSVCVFRLKWILAVARVAGTTISLSGPPTASEPLQCGWQTLSWTIVEKRSKPHCHMVWNVLMICNHMQDQTLWQVVPCLFGPRHFFCKFSVRQVCFRCILICCQSTNIPTTHHGFA